MHSPACSWVPALATNAVTHVAPGQRVAAALSHGVLRVTLAIRPPGVEVTVVSAFGVASDLAPLEGSHVGGVVAGSDLTEHVERSGDDAERGGGRQEDGGEGNHCE